MERNSLRKISLNIDLYQMQVFLTAAESENFTKTARILNITQSAVSKNIAAIEASFGLHLFLRNRNGVTLLPAGKCLYEDIRQIIPKIEAGIRHAIAIQSEQNSRVRVGIPNSVWTDKYYAGALERFSAKYPHVLLELEQVSVPDLMKLLLADNIDLIFAALCQREWLEKNGIRCMVIEECPCVASVHKSNPLFQKESLSFEDIRSEKVVGINKMISPLYMEMVEDVYKKHGCLPQYALFASSQISALANLRLGRGIMITDRFFYDNDNPNIRHFTLEDTKSGLIVAWHAETENHYIDLLAREIIP